MIDGQLVMDRDGMTTIDEAKLHSEANAAAERLREAMRRCGAARIACSPQSLPSAGSFACRTYHVHRLACDPLPSSAETSSTSA